jgi:hypothetical protein
VRLAPLKPFSSTANALPASALDLAAPKRQINCAAILGRHSRE